MSEVTNIYLDNKKKEEHVLTDASAAEKYIILQNEHLEASNQYFQKCLKEREHEIFELENDCGRMEHEKTYMGGIIKNCVELDKIRQEIITISDTKQRQRANFLVKLTKHTRILQIIMSMMVLFSFQFSQSFMDFTILTLSMCCIASFQESLLMNLKPPKNDEMSQRLKKLFKEAENISVAQKHLENYISEL